MTTIRPLRRSILVSLLAVSLIPGASAMGAPKEIGADGILDQIFGKWFIASFDIAPISAVSAEQAESFVGKWASFDRKFVQFGDLKCSEPVYREVTPVSGESGSTDIIIDCKAPSEIVPNLSYNQRDRRLVAELDGATYRLARNR